MLSSEPGSVSYSKLVRLDVVRCPSLNRQGVTERRAKGNGTIHIGDKRMTLIKLSIKMSKTAAAKTCTLHADWKKCCIFQEEKNEDLTQRPTNSPEYHYGCYTMIVKNMQYFSSMPSGSFVLDHIRLDKGVGSTEEEQYTSTRQMYQETGCRSL